MPQHPPKGMVIGEDGKVEVDFDVITRTDILQANAENLITPAMAQQFLQGLRDHAANIESERTTSIGGQLSKALNPFDKRGVGDFFGIPVKKPLFFAGLGIATAGLSLSVAAPTLGATTIPLGPAAPILAGVGGAARSLASTIGGALTKKNLAIAGVGTVTALGANAIFGGDGDPSQAQFPQNPQDGTFGPPPPPPGEAEDPTTAAFEAGRIAREEAIAKQEEFANQGIQTETYEKQVWDELNQEWVTTQVVVPFTVNAEGVKTFGQSFNPLETKIAQQNSIAQAEKREKKDGQQTSALEQIQILEMLSDPFVANKLRFALARGEGQKFLDLGLPPEIIALFGGSNAELGNRVDGTGNEANLSQGQRNKLGVDIEGNAIPGATSITGQPAQDVTSSNLFPGSPSTALRDALTGSIDQKGSPVPGDGKVIDQRGFPVPGPISGTGQTGSVTSNLFAMLNQPQTGENFGPALQGQLSPGSVRGLSDNQIGALRAAFVNSGSTLQEEQRKARRSSLA